MLESDLISYKTEFFGHLYYIDKDIGNSTEIANKNNGKFYLIKQKFFIWLRYKVIVRLILFLLLLLIIPISFKSVSIFALGEFLSFFVVISVFFIIFPRYTIQMFSIFFGVEEYTITKLFSSVFVVTFIVNFAFFEISIFPDHKHMYYMNSISSISESSSWPYLYLTSNNGNVYGIDELPNNSIPKK
jgi:hypothetical protein